MIVAASWQYRGLVCWYPVSYANKTLTEVSGKVQLEIMDPSCISQLEGFQIPNSKSHLPLTALLIPPLLQMHTYTE